VSHQNGRDGLSAEGREKVTIFMRHFLDQLMSAQQPKPSAHLGRASTLLFCRGGRLAKQDRPNILTNWWHLSY